MPPFFLLLIGSIAVVALLVAAVVLLRRRVALARQVSQTSVGLWNDLQKWLRRLFLLDLRQTMRLGVRTLRQSTRTSNFRYDRPWYLLLGPPGSGKTTLLRALTQPHPFSDNGLLNWGIFRDGVILDLAGQYSTPEEPSRFYHYRRRVWRTFLRLLLYYRERRPLDGIVVVLPVHSYQRFTESERQRASTLCEQLRFTARRLGMVIPVYVVVTHTDHFEGFTAFTEALPPEHRQHILGWNSPYNPDALLQPSWAIEGIGSILEQLCQLQIELMRRSKSPESIFSLYDSFKGLIEPAQQWLEQLFSSNKRAPWLVLRGVYFTGVIMTDTPAHEHSLTHPYACFTQELFRKKVFSEPAVAVPKRRYLIRRTLTSIAAHVLCGIALVGMLTALAVQWKPLQQRKHTLEQMFERIRDEQRSYRYEREKLTNPYYYADKTRQYLAYFATLEQNKLLSYGLPPSWLGMFHNRLRGVIARSLREVVMAGMKEEFIRRARLLTDPNTSYLPLDTLTLTRLTLATTPEYVALVRYVQAVAEFEYHVGLYNSLAQPHRDQRLAKIIDYLYQVHVEEDIAQLIESDYQLTQRVRVDPLQLDEFRQHFARQALDLVDRCTEKATLSNAVTGAVTMVQHSYATLFTAAEDDERVGAFRQLAGALERLAAALHHPESEWLSRQVYISDAATTKLLERIATSRLLGGAVRARFDQRMDSLFSVMRRRLLTTAVHMRNENADTTTIVYQHPESRRFQLTPPFAQTLTAFAELRKQPFGALEDSRLQLSSLAEQLSSSHYILWNSTLLKSLSPAIDGYVKFLNEQLNLFPPELQIPAERVLQRGMHRMVEDLVVRSAQVQPGSLYSSEEEISLQTSTLVESAPHLSLALRQLSTNSDGSGSQFAQILASQVASIFETLTRWLNNRGLYAISITAEKLLSWKPTTSVQALAFDIGSPEEAQEYLTRQREPVEQWCKQYAAPLLAFYTSSGITAQARLSPSRAGAIQQWSQIVRTLEAYTAKAPNNSLAKLENYILSLGTITMQTPAELQKALIPYSANSRMDYFAAKQRDIANEIRRGIVSNATRRIREDYRKIYHSTTALQRYFPFSIATAEADPVTVKNYFSSINGELAFARTLTAIGGTIPDATADVLTQLATAQEFLRPALYASDPSGGAYTVTFTYRTNTSAEQNTNVVYTIITIQSPNGQESRKLLFTPGEQANLTWHVGDAISIDIRWAKDATVTPIESVESKYQLGDSRTASFRFGGTWSLLRLLANQRMPNGSPRPRLRFQVLTSAPVTTSATNDPTMVLYIDMDIAPFTNNDVPSIPFIGALPAPE